MNLITKNKKAYFDYEILDTIEAGVVLVGAEVKSIYNKRVNLKGSFCKFFKGELFVMDMHISKFEHDNSWSEHQDLRPRKLLLKKKELRKLEIKVEEDGLSIIPLKIYFNENNKCKIEIGICKGKKLYDKRESSKEKTIKRSVEKEFKQKIK